MVCALIYTILTPENKLLIEEGKKQGLEFERINDNQAILQLTQQPTTVPETILQRSSSFTRTLYLTHYFETHGSWVVNTFFSQQVCGDKAYCSTLLAKAGVPTPRTFLAFSQESAMKAIDNLGYPCVIKPTIGSWARLVHRINDRDAAEAVLECREVMGSAWQQIYYVQEHINKPGRDIRAFVVGDEVICAIYRISTEKSGWVTNTGRGGKAENCPLTDELEEICLKAVGILDEGIYGIDIMETDAGYVVHEINHTTEFRNSIAPTGVNIAEKMISWIKQKSKQ
ncbi:MAG: lysine biosynthesis protein LysX [Candidatus Anstonellales archaeon]